MPLYRYASAKLEPVLTTSLAAEKIRERADLQKALRESIEIIGDDLLFVAEEYSLFQDSTRRIDLLAIDRSGGLVVIELKRTDDGGHMELQALRYAAMVSTMTTDQLYAAHAHYNGVDETEARQAISDWVDEVELVDPLANKVRIILVSGNFSAEIMSTVLWLTQNYELDIACHRISSYKLDAEVIFDIQQIVPLPEAADFQIQQRRKGAAAAATKASGEGRDYTKYDVWIGDDYWASQSKQMAVKVAMTGLYKAGLNVKAIQEVTAKQRWVEVHPFGGESVEQAFIREYPKRSPRHLWFDLNFVEAEIHWVSPRYGGTDTEPMLTKLAEVGKPVANLRWSQSTGSMDAAAPGDAELYDKAVTSAPPPSIKESGYPGLPDQ